MAASQRSWMIRPCSMHRPQLAFSCSSGTPAQACQACLLRPLRLRHQAPRTATACTTTAPRPVHTTHQSHTTPASADATAAAMPQPPTPTPAATPSPPSLDGQVDPSCVLPQPTVPLQAALVARDASSRPDTFYHSTAAAQCAVLPVGLDPVEARQKRRADDAHACAPYAHAPTHSITSCAPSHTVHPPARVSMHVHRMHMRLCSIGWPESRPS